MIRKSILLSATLLLAAATCAARSLPDRYSPYQYSHRWYISFQAGPVLSATQHMNSFWKNGKGFDALSWHGALAFGYNFTDAWDLRVSGVYGYNAGALSPYQGFYPYRFHAAHLFADMILNYNALAEYNVPFNFKTYIGLGAACTFGFSHPLHPYQVLDSPNLSPAVRIGAIFEYDYKRGFGWFADLGVEAFNDWYNGHESDNFPLDMGLKLSLGVIYHFPLK
jgi:hypothetical protein